MQIKIKTRRRVRVFILQITGIIENIECLILNPRSRIFTAGKQDHSDEFQALPFQQSVLIIKGEEI
jgi:hypothetical protein